MSVCKCGDCKYCRKTTEVMARDNKLESAQVAKRKRFNVNFDRSIARGYRGLGNCQTARARQSQLDVTFMCIWWVNGYSAGRIGRAWGESDNYIRGLVYGKSMPHFNRPPITPRVRRSRVTDEPMPAQPVYRGNWDGPFVGRHGVRWCRHCEHAHTHIPTVPTNHPGWPQVGACPRTGRLIWWRSSSGMTYKAPKFWEPSR